MPVSAMIIHRGATINKAPGSSRLQLNEILPSGQRWRVLPRSTALGFAAGSPIITMTGVLPVQSLVAGLRLPARAGMTRIASVQARHHVTAALVTIPAHSFGKGLPETDLTVGADQMITLPGAATSAEFRPSGSDVLLRPKSMQMPAGRLAAFGFHTKPHVRDGFTLWEVEIEREDYLLASNLPVLAKAGSDALSAGLANH